MKEIQKALHEAQVDTALNIIEEINAGIDLDLINALSDLLQVMHHDQKISLEVHKLAIALLEVCKEEVDPQLITATANLMKFQV